MDKLHTFTIGILGQAKRLCITINNNKLTWFMIIILSLAIIFSYILYIYNMDVWNNVLETNNYDDKIEINYEIDTFDCNKDETNFEQNPTDGIVNDGESYSIVTDTYSTIGDYKFVYSSSSTMENVSNAGYYSTVTDSYSTVTDSYSIVNNDICGKVSNVEPYYTVTDRSNAINRDQLSNSQKLLEFASIILSIIAIDSLFYLVCRCGPAVVDYSTVYLNEYRFQLSRGPEVTGGAPHDYADLYDRMNRYGTEVAFQADLIDAINAPLPV